MTNIRSSLNSNPIIAACSFEEIDTAMLSPVEIILIMQAGIGDLFSTKCVQTSRKKQLLVHIDLIRGITGDRESLEYIKQTTPHIGIVSTKGTTIRLARRIGLTAVQRIFLIDTQSLRNSIESLKSSKPDAVEIMPGIATGIIRELKSQINCPLIAAGLLRSTDEIQTAIQAGADGISCSSKELWHYSLNSNIHMT